MRNPFCRKKQKEINDLRELIGALNKNIDNLMSENRKLKQSNEDLVFENKKMSDENIKLLQINEKLEEKHKNYVKKVNDKTVDAKKKWLNSYPEE